MFNIKASWLNDSSVSENCSQQAAACNASTGGTEPANRMYNEPDQGKQWAASSTEDLD